MTEQESPFLPPAGPVEPRNRPVGTSGRPEGSGRVYEVEIPLHLNRPPLNHNYRLHWREKAKRTVVVRSLVYLNARHRKLPKGVEHITVQLHYAPGDRRTRRDGPNLTATSKPAIDGLVDAGIVPDDTAEFVTELMPVIHPGPGVRRMWLTVEVLGEDR